MNNIYFMVGILGVSWVLMVLATAFIPFYSRKSVAFGVSIPESEYYSEFIKKLRYSYLAACLILGGMIAAGSSISYFWWSAKATMFIHLVAVFVYLIFIAALYLVFYRRVRIYRESNDWLIENTSAAFITADNEKKPLNQFWFLAYLAVIAGTVAAVYVKYPALPAIIPMHYNLTGEVDRYAAKSVSKFLTIPIIQSLMGLLYFGVNYAIANSKRQSSSGDVESGFRKDRAFHIIMSRSLFVIGLMTMLLFSTIELSMLMILKMQATIIAPAVFMLIIFVIIVYWLTKVGQGGSRMEGGSGIPAKTIQDDSRWILGIFYYNKNDPSFFVEKRFGIGYTLNFGNPRSWIAVLGLIVIIAAVFILQLAVH